MAVHVEDLDLRIGRASAREFAGLHTDPVSEPDHSIRVSRKGIYPNLDYPSGPAYNLIGYDTLTFTPLFIAARIVGWTSHILEQQASNALIRPLSAYNGVDERHIDGYVADTAAIDVQERPEEAIG